MASLSATSLTPTPAEDATLFVNNDENVTSQKKEAKKRKIVKVETKAELRQRVLELSEENESLSRDKRSRSRVTNFVTKKFYETVTSGDSLGCEAMHTEPV